MLDQGVLYRGQQVFGLAGVQPRYGQKPPSVDHGVSFRCSDEVSALVVKAAVEVEHRETVPT
jgi:hypothetical protein